VPHGDDDDDEVLEELDACDMTSWRQHHCHADLLPLAAIRGTASRSSIDGSRRFRTVRV
jgi:hypothetical protein